MATRKRVRHTIDLVFANEEARESFKTKLNDVKRLLSPADRGRLDNLGLMTALFELADRHLSHRLRATQNEVDLPAPSDEVASPTLVSGHSFMNQSGTHLCCGILNY